MTLEVQASIARGRRNGFDQAVNTAMELTIATSYFLARDYALITPDSYGPLHGAHTHCNGSCQTKKVRLGVEVTRGIPPCLRSMAGRSPHTNMWKALASVAYDWDLVLAKDKMLGEVNRAANIAQAWRRCLNTCRKNSKRLCSQGRRLAEAKGTQS